MPKCQHSYQEHANGFAAFCKANPDRWYPFTLLGCMGVLTLVVLALTLYVWFRLT